MNLPDHSAIRFFRRLVVHVAKPRFSETDFLQQQLAVLEAYLEPFPSDERDGRALAWIEANAQQYRQQWQRRHPAQTAFWG